MMGVAGSSQLLPTCLVENVFPWCETYCVEMFFQVEKMLACKVCFLSLMITSNQLVHMHRKSEVL